MMILGWEKNGHRLQTMIHNLFSDLITNKSVVPITIKCDHRLTKFESLYNTG